MKKIKSFINNQWPKIVSVFFFVLLLSAYVNTFAIFTPGQTLDPNCSPGVVGCTVSVGGGSSPISVVNSNNLFSTGLSGTGSGITTSITDSIFLGSYAGSSATSATNSNFFGLQSGQNATSASNSNFLGHKSGYSATNAEVSNFIGFQTGYSATNASGSNFIGIYAGYNATNASNSIFIGKNSGFNDTVNNTLNGLTSILLGSYTNTGGYSNSVVLGSGTSSFPISNTKANQFMLSPSITEMRLRGIDYTLPLSQASTSGQVLTNNGSGGLSWTTVSGGVLCYLNVVMD